MNVALQIMLGQVAAANIVKKRLRVKAVLAADLLPELKGISPILNILAGALSGSVK